VVVPQASGAPLVGEGAKRLRAQVADLKLRPNQSIFFETKNDMGIRRTYKGVPPGFQKPHEIAQHVLSRLLAGSRNEKAFTYDRSVITVPASFRTPQRQDTMLAAAGAGMELTPECLLDEPIAAFIDFAVREPQLAQATASGSREVVVFDFGGGTCDVAVLSISSKPDGTLTVANRAVSRYFRLGGGDIDRAIVHEVLIPALLKENPDLAADPLTYEEKKLILEPTLLSDAEALKVGLCIELHRRIGHGVGHDELLSTKKTLSSTRQVTIRGRKAHLTRPTLSGDQFEELLAPFLDPDVLAQRDGEYVTRCSIFAPIKGAMRQAGIDPARVTDCIIVGGSSLIPQVADAVRGHMPRAVVYTAKDYDIVKNCVSRGAAYYALALEISGKSPVTATASDSLYITHAKGHVELLSAGQALPYPEGRRFASCDKLGFPNDCNDQTVKVRIELSNAAGGRILYSGVLELPGPVRKGEQFLVDYRVEADQIPRLRVRKAGTPEAQAVEAKIENPLTIVEDPSKAREEIDRLEEDLRTGVIPPADSAANFEKLARLLVSIGHRERALNFYLKLKASQRKPSDLMMINLAFLLRDLGDIKRADSTFREAIAPADSTLVRFYYANFLWSQGRHADAKREIDRLLTVEQDGHNFTLSAMIETSLRAKEAAQDAARAAIISFGPAVLLDQYELDWLERAARIAGDNTVLADIAEQRKRRPADKSNQNPESLPLLLDGGQ
jgi:molecular chaperone DnaK (HSP70)